MRHIAYCETVIWYYENGVKEAIETYSNDELNGRFIEYYEDGNLYFQTNYINGLQEGRTIYFYGNGEKQSEGLYLADEPFGEWGFYNEEGEEIHKKEFKKKHNIIEAGFEVSFPTTKWELTNYKKGETTEYIFKREEIEDDAGRSIIPAVMIYIEDASTYEDLMVFSSLKQIAFTSKGVKIDKIITHESNEFPLNYKNAIIYKCSYNNGLDHVLYMVHLITEDKKGVQLYLDMTKSIAHKYEEEFISILKSIGFL